MRAEQKEAKLQEQVQDEDRREGESKMLSEHRRFQVVVGGFCTVVRF